MKKKMILPLVAIGVSVFLMLGCMAREVENEYSEETTEEYSEEYSEELLDDADEDLDGEVMDGDGLATGLYKEITSVGDEITGTIALDQGQWTVFVEEDDYADEEESLISMCQASTFDMSSIITLQTLDVDRSTEDLGSAMIIYMQENGAENVEGAKDQKIGDYTGIQVYGYYPDIQTYLCCWFFETGDGYKHYCCVEFPKEEYYAFEMCQNNYKFN